MATQQHQLLRARRRRKSAATSTRSSAICTSRSSARLDLSTIGTMREDELRREVRRIAEQLCRHRTDLLSQHEKGDAGQRRAGRGLRTGAARAAVPRHGDHRHSGQRSEDRLRRASRAAGVEQRAVHRRGPRAGHHPSDRRPGGPADRRDDADGRRAAARRKPAERHRRAVGVGRPAGFHSAVWRAAAERRRSAGEPLADAGDPRVSGGLRGRAGQRARFRAAPDRARRRC